MTKHVAPGDLQALFDQAVNNPKLVSFADRSAMFIQAMLHPPVAFFAPGIEQIGKVRMRTYSYMRNSKGRFEVSTSLLRQFSPVREFADSNNLQLLGFYCDADTSGQALVDLPGLMTLILLCRTGGVDAIIIEDADRLARSGFLLVIFDLLAQHNIVIFDLMLGRPLTRDMAMLKAYIATQEVQKLGARTGRGASIKAAQRDTITKPLGAGHMRPYPRGPVMIHPVFAARILEASHLYDTGFEPLHIIKRFNGLWLAGNQDYRPPGRTAKTWQHTHLVSYTRQKSGMLECFDNIGEFIHGKSISKKDIGSGKIMTSWRDPEDVHTVVRPDLLIIPKDMFRRNRARLDEKAERCRERREARKNKQPVNGPPATYAHGGKGRNLLSGRITCCTCGTHKFTYMRKARQHLLRCSGISVAACNSYIAIDSVMFDNALLDVLEPLLSPSGVVDHFSREYERAHASIISDLASSRESLEDELDKAKEELKDVVHSKRGTEGSARQIYADQEKVLASDIAKIEKKLAALESSSFGTGPVRKDLLDKCRSLLARLRNRATYSSDDEADVWIVQAVRNMISVKVERAIFEHGAKAIVTIDFSQFFRDEAEGFERKLSFEIHTTPVQRRFCSPADSAIDLSVFDKPEKYKLKENDWREVNALMKPHRTAEKREFYSTREDFEAIFLSLRAGAGPCTKSNPHQDYYRACLTNYWLRKLGLWAEVIKTMRAQGNKWLDKLDPALVEYLHGAGGIAKGPWLVTEPVFMKSRSGT